MFPGSENTHTLSYTPSVKTSSPSMTRCFMDSSLLHALNSPISGYSFFQITTCPELLLLPNSYMRLLTVPTSSQVERKKPQFDNDLLGSDFLI
jgi:hypothetical protein